MQNIRLFSPEENCFTGKIAEYGTEDDRNRFYFLLNRQASDSEILTTYELTKVTDDIYELIFFFLGQNHVMLVDLKQGRYQDTVIQADHLRQKQNGSFRFV
ncbi:MAG: hypothetical protein IKS51_00880 [Erysipelotrichaceae bacterium]|nr:hypothetical protein [Erysipelotrichaceae bacterium]